MTKKFSVPLLAMLVVFASATANSDDGYPEERQELIQIINEKDELIEEQALLIAAYRSSYLYVHRYATEFAPEPDPSSSPRRQDGVVTDICPEGYVEAGKEFQYEPANYGKTFENGYPSAAADDNCGKWCGFDCPVPGVERDWPGVIHYCAWITPSVPEDTVVYFMEILWTLENPTDERWDRFDVAYRVYLDGELAVEDAGRNLYYQPPAPGKTSEYYTGDSFPVLRHTKSESLVDKLAEREHGTPIPWHWYLISTDGTEDTRIDEPDLDSATCEVEYTNFRNDSIYD